MKKFKIILVAFLLVCFVGTAWAAKTWKGMNLENCTMVGTMATENGTVLTSDIITSAITTTIRADQTGKVFDNYGATGSITYTLPAWALGLSYTVTLSTSQNVIINPTDSSQILRLTNAYGDALAADSVGESVTLVATGISTWVPRELGTWTDVD